MSSKKSNSRLFSGFFLINLFFSLAFSLLVFFLFIRLKTTENTTGNYFSKVLSNFQQNFEDSLYSKSIKKWFNPELKSDSQEQLNTFKLTILAKTINTYFNTLLVDTQNNIVTDNLHSFISEKTTPSLKQLKKEISQHILNNPELREVSTYDLEGNKIFGIKFKNTPNYVFSKDVMNDLIKSKNLLLKQGQDNNLILLSLIEDKEKKPFMIVSQSIHHSFFDRVLKHLGIADNVFYLKDSENFVLFDNQGSTQSAPIESGFSYRVFKTLTQAEESNLKVNLNDVSYSIGTIVQKNNVWGNVAALVFFLFIFVVLFFFIDQTVALFKRFVLSSTATNTNPYIPRESSTPINASSLNINPRSTTDVKRNSLGNSLDESNKENESNIDSAQNSTETKPLTLEQYLLKEKKDKL